MASSNNRSDALLESLLRKQGLSPSRREFVGRLGALLGGALLLPLNRWGGLAKAQVVEPADFFVAPGGSNANPGTLAQPFATIQRAIDAAQPGDLIYVRGGVYQQRVNTTKNGSPANPIRIEGFPDETVIIDGTGVSGPLIRMNNSANLIWRRFLVRDSNAQGILIIQSDNIVLEDIMVTRCRADGIRGTDTNDCRLERVTVAECYDAATGGNNADGCNFGQGNTTSKRNQFIDCNFIGNSDDGLDLYGAQDCLVDRCRSARNGFVRGNVNNPAPNGDGNGFKLAGRLERGSGGHRVQRSLAWQNKRRGFDHNGSFSILTIYNNTAWDNGNVNFNFPNERGLAHRLRNNISFQAPINIGSDINDAFNSWNLGITNPQFISLNENNPDFLMLQPDSPAIDAGVDVGLPFNGTAPDLGAFESPFTNEMMGM